MLKHHLTSTGTLIHSQRSVLLGVNCAWGQLRVVHGDGTDSFQLSCWSSGKEIFFGLKSNAQTGLENQWIHTLLSYNIREQSVQGNNMVYLHGMHFFIWGSLRLFQPVQDNVKIGACATHERGCKKKKKSKVKDEATFLLTGFHNQQNKIPTQYVFILHLH